MVVFSLKDLEVASKLTGLPMVNILHYCRKGGIPKSNKSKYLRIQPSKVLAGSSFLLDEINLLKDSTDNVYKEQYIKLAAKRSYFLYKHSKIITLSLYEYPDLDLKAIQYNPLLYIDASNNMHFKFEHLKLGLRKT